MIRSLSSLAIALMFGLVNAAYAAPTTTSSLSLQSQTGDWVGQGKTISVNDSNATFKLRKDKYRNITIATVENKDLHWDIFLEAPFGTNLSPGNYYNAERSVLQSGRSPGLDVSGNGHGCNQIWGNFTINQIEFDSLGNPTMLDASFTQRCESATAPALWGTIKYKAPPLYFYVNSAPGEYLGKGVTKTYTSATSLFTIFRTKTPFPQDTRFRYSASGLRDTWSVEITAPTGKQLAPGTYSIANYADEKNAGFYISVNSSTCTPSGTLTINSISFDSNKQVAGVAASFLAYCGKNPNPLRGIIRYYE